MIPVYVMIQKIIDWWFDIHTSIIRSLFCLLYLSYNWRARNMRRQKGWAGSWSLLVLSKMMMTCYAVLHKLWVARSCPQALINGNGFKENISSSSMTALPKLLTSIVAIAVQLDTRYARFYLPLYKTCSRILIMCSQRWQCPIRHTLQGRIVYFYLVLAWYLLLRLLKFPRNTSACLKPQRFP